MSRVVLFISCTVDGFIAREDGKVDFLDPYNKSNGEDYGFKELIQSISAIVMGNTTFQEYNSHPMFFEYYAGKELYVFSRNKNLKHNKVTFVHDDPKIFLENLKTEKDIWLLGGGGLIETFLNKELIDKFIITIIPTLIGIGIPLFRQTNHEVNLKLENTESFDSGVVNLYYTKK